MSDDKTIRVYDTKAAEYADLTAGISDDPRLADFLARLPQGAAVLDLGCGPGGAAAIMAAAGCRVEAWDASAEMVRLADRHAGVTAHQRRFEALAELPTRGLDGVWANFSLLHAPRDQMPRHLADIARALREGGTFLIALKAGTGDKRDALGRLYTYYTEDELRALLLRTDLHPERFDSGREKGLDGAEADWISLTCRRGTPA